MSKLKAGTAGDYLEVAARSLSQQNFPDVYTYASIALAMGAARGALYLCAYSRQQIDVLIKQKSPGVMHEATNFGIMYKLSEHFQVPGYTEFTSFYTLLYSKIQEPVKKAVISSVATYKSWLETAKTECPEGSKITIQTGNELVGVMKQLVAQNITVAVVQHHESTHLLKDVSGDHYGNGSPNHHQDEVPVAGKQSIISKFFSCCFGGNGEE